MSALPLSIHDLSIPDLSTPEIPAPEIRDGLPARPVDRAGTIARPRRTTSANWQLTDRGIAVVMVIVALIMAAALAVIGLTVLRVTYPEPPTRDLGDLVTVAFDLVLVIDDVPLCLHVFAAVHIDREAIPERGYEGLLHSRYVMSAALDVHRVFHAELLLLD